MQKRIISMLVLIGPCPGDYLHNVIGPACTNNPVSGRDHHDWLWLSDDEVAYGHFETAHAYVQPSFAEGFWHADDPSHAGCGCGRGALTAQACLKLPDERRCSSILPATSTIWLPLSKFLCSMTNHERD